ncbi:Cytochrome P450 709B2 [Linum perenne]
MKKLKGRKKTHIMSFWVSAIGAALTGVIVFKIWKVFWMTHVITKRLGIQGVKCPPYSFHSGSLKQVKIMQQQAKLLLLHSSSNDIISRVLPHYHQWSTQYGETFFYWAGTQPRVYISDPELVKQILSNRLGLFVKPEARACIKTLVGKGVSLANGVEWVRRRKILNPAFSMDKLKTMAEVTESMLDEWEIQAMSAKDNLLNLEMNSEFQKLTADIIAHTAFGSSYAQGKQAFLAQKHLQFYCADSLLTTFLPGTHRYIPTPSNIQMWRLDKKVRNSLGNIVKSRLDSDSTTYGDDLLGLLIGSSSYNHKGDEKKLDLNEIIEECKTFFFAGHETTSNLLTWTIFLLSVHPDWQSRIREEVQTECVNGVIDNADTLSKLRLVNMVLMEALRLYSPITELIREASEDSKVGDVTIPKGACVLIPITKIHRSKEHWGDDANDFNPWRFRDGIMKAVKHPSAFLPFGLGARVCIGQNFAMMETKTVLAMVIKRFSFSLSSDYKHAPISYISMQPEFGLPVLVRPLILPN